jgi:hypothetical protein
MLAGILKFGIRQSEIHGLDEIRISLPRAREILSQCTKVEKSPKARGTYSMDKHLDAIHFGA